MRNLLVLSMLAACTTPAPSPSLASFVPVFALAPSSVHAATFDGVIMSRQSRLVSAEVDGRIEKLLVQDGMRVTAGAPIATLDQKELDKQLEAARGAEDSAQGQLLQSLSQRAEAGRQYHQQRGLYSDHAVSRDSVASAASAYQVAAAAVKAAEGAVRRAKAAREEAEQAVAKASVTSPIDGVITLVAVHEGGLAARGQPIARVFDPSDLWIRFAVPAELRDRLKPGDKVTATPRPNGTPIVATVVTVNRTLEPPLQFAVVEADLDDASLPDHDALLGTQVEVR
jgi:RND family efflux transporter MFP subunit